MKIEQVKKLTPMQRLVYWIKERESIRLKRLNEEPKPWTDDPILQAYRFCNVRRMDDKVSKWLSLNWYIPYHGHKNMMVACALARFINLPASLENVGFPTTWNPERLKTKLRRFRDFGNQIFNGAYMIRCNDNMDKIEYVVDYCCSPLVTNRIPIIQDCMKETWTRLKECFGFGSFMSGQVVADLRWAFPGSWLDREFWAPQGPGSTRGLYRLHGEPIKSSMKPQVFAGRLDLVIDALKTKLPTSITNRLEAMDYQNCLCEFDKYERTLFDNRHPKSRYNGL